jgi:hypothetical protein
MIDATTLVLFLVFKAGLLQLGGSFTVNTLK